MTTELIEILVSIGVPATILALLVITIIFRASRSKLTTLAGLLTLVFASAYAFAELYPAARDAALGEDISIVLEPEAEAWTALGSGGSPISVTVRAERGGQAIASRRLAAEDAESFRGRQLQLRKSDGQTRFTVAYKGTDIGTLSSDDLRRIGWLPKSEGNPADDRSRPSQVWSTGRVIAGQTVDLGMGTYGAVELRVDGYNQRGEATVSLLCPGLIDPVPEILRIANKTLDFQTFDGKHEFIVAVREADLRRSEVQQPWAAFTVIGP